MAVSCITIYYFIARSRRLRVVIFARERKRSHDMGGYSLIDTSEVPLVSVRIENGSHAVPERLRKVHLEGMTESSRSWHELPFTVESYEHCAGLPFVLESLGSINARYSDFNSSMMDDFPTLRANVETEDGRHWYSAPTHLRDLG